MAQKESILFVNESLRFGGGEKSLLNLLAALDYDRFDVYLQLFDYGNPWDAHIDPRVKLLPPLPYCEFTKLSLVGNIKKILKGQGLKYILSRLHFSYKLRTTKNQNNIVRSCLYWQTQSRCFGRRQDVYDYVIAYAQGIPTFYVAEKTMARKKKLAWINATYVPDSYRKYIEKLYDSYDTIVGVSDVISDLERTHFPSFGDRIKTFMDLINPEVIHKLSNGPVEVEPNVSGLTLVTVGRVNPQKGYDIAVEAARVLKERGIDFKWYVVGYGPKFEEIKSLIVMHGLADKMILLGSKSNPYPYYRLADIYVQPSRYEGFGLTIAEARILNIPVVCTRFNSVFMQMKEGKNGLVADMDGISIAKSIIRLWQNKELYDSIKSYLMHEKKGNLDLVPEFYNLLK